jgi:hypothetical protein
VDEGDMPGVGEWLLTGGAMDPPGPGWTAPALTGGAGLWVVPRGRGGLRDRRKAEMLAHLLEAEDREVIVDCGVLGAPDAPEGSGPGDTAGHLLAARAGTSLLVTKACALAMRRVAATRVPVTGIVLLREPGRTLLGADVEEMVGAPVIAEVGYDLAVARAMDTGRMGTHVPPVLEEALRRSP